MLVEVLAVKDKSWFGKIISFIRRSEVSHLALRWNGVIYEMGLKHPQSTQEFYYKWGYEVIATYDIDNNTVVERLNSMSGASYNFLAILFFYPNRWLKKSWGKSAKNKMCVNYVGHVIDSDLLTFKTAPDEVEALFKKE